MPRGSKGDKRRADVVGNAAVDGMRMATGEIEDRRPTPRDGGKNPAAVALGRRGGKARAEAMTKKQRRLIAQRAAKARWSKV